MPTAAFPPWHAGMPEVSEPTRRPGALDEKARPHRGDRRRRQIGYSLLFRIANGDMLGRDQPVLLQLLELPIDKAQAALKGVMMELEDCAFPLLAGMSGSGDPKAAFKDAEMALLVGARPRGPGMERKDLLLENARIFIEQGKAMDAVASRGIKVLVVGNPANTNAYIAMKSAPGLPQKNFTAMLRLDHNRALSQLAAKSGKPVGSIDKLIVWGNHSPTMYPDYRFATADGQSLKALINDENWNRTVFLPTVGKRGAAVEARAVVGRLAANAAIDHARLDHGQRRQVGDDGCALGWQLRDPQGHHVRRAGNDVRRRVSAHHRTRDRRFLA